jgi:erythromycin esterase-like protein
MTWPTLWAQRQVGRQNQGLLALVGPGLADHAGLMDTSLLLDQSAQELRQAAVPVSGSAEDYDSLLTLIGDRRFVLIGEASHGTHEFYRERARITRRLIDELGFSVVAVEGDWPDAYRVNRYVMGMSADQNADAALEGFRRFPTWMWRNQDVLGFVQWLRARNDAQIHPASKARFYGLDLYSLHTSIEAVIGYPNGTTALLLF